jgi:hypothetical protein
MPEATVEVTALEGIDLEAAPPCSMITERRTLRLRWRRRECGRPATHRVKVTCPVHGTRLRFLCGRHLRVLKWGWASCWTCDSRSTIRFGGHC